MNSSLMQPLAFYSNTFHLLCLLPFHIHTVKYTLDLLNWKEGTNLKYLQAG